MTTKYNGREYKWWIVRNAHLCKLCVDKYGAEKVYKDDNHPGRLGKQLLKKRGNTRGQYSKGYWTDMSRLFDKHIDRYHPDVRKTKA
jgi:hypothetical protein